MAKRKKAVTYRALERPYTRFSKFKNKSFVRARPVNRVVRYDMGDPKKKFTYRVRLQAKSGLQIRDCAIESARQTTNKYLETKAGKGNYQFKLLLYPHQVLRENPLAAGAGADRMSSGMKHSFGKPVGVAARVKKGKIILQVDVFDINLELAKHAVKRASYKLPCSCQVLVDKIV